MAVKLFVYIRSDLNMRRGKIAAQSAHAALGLWTNAMQKTDHFMKMNNKNSNLFKSWLNNNPIDNLFIIPVDSEEDLMAKYNSFDKNKLLITDQGRTEFGGKPTNTCFSYLESEETIDFFETPKSIKKDDESFSTKQSFAVNKSIKMDKWEMAKYVCFSSIMSVFNDFKDTETGIIIEYPNEGFKNWILGFFAKIVLQGSDNKISQIANTISESADYKKHHILNYENKNFIVCIGGDEKSKIDPITSKLSLY